MIRRGPLVTLLAVAGVVLVLMLANTVTQTGNRAAAPPDAVGTAGTRAAPPPPPQAPPAPPDQIPPDQIPPGEVPPEEAPPEEAPPVGLQDSYTGRTSGNEATVAFALGEDVAIAYVCNGRDVETWLEGTVAGDQLVLRGQGASIDATLRAEAVFGIVTVGDRTWPFSAQRAEEPAGLYQGRGTAGDGATDDPARVGWIVQPDGSQVGLADIGGRLQPAPRLDPDRLQDIPVGGTTVDAWRVGG